mgnify:CR=1 FL=1
MNVSVYRGGNMIKENIHRFIKENYKKDVVYDMLLKNDYHITFFMDLFQPPREIYIVTGDLKELGLPQFDKISFKEMIPYIETDNALAEVEGKMTFIEDLDKKINNITSDTHVYVPIRGDLGMIWLYLSLQVVTKRDGKTELVFGRVTRISKETPEEIIYYQKTHQDTLTTLFTREALKKHMNYLVDYEQSYGLYIDIDGFKSVNDQYGHECGDEFLKIIAKHFIDKWEANVIYYRLGGDEFFVYISNHTPHEAKKRAQSIIDDIESLDLKGRPIDVSASVGIVPITDETKGYQRLLDLGDKAMYQSKARGRGQYTLLEEYLKQ